jgi:hypothetical protein
MALLGLSPATLDHSMILIEYGPGEMHTRYVGPDSFLNLPRQGGVAYAAQESWVHNASIRVSRTPHAGC